MKRPSPSEPRDDRELREFFAAVHAEDRTPPFERLLRAPSAPRARGRWLPAAALLAATVTLATIGWLVPRLGDSGPGRLSEEEQLALARELSTWSGPLDFLLETPGREVLSTAPSFTLTDRPPPAGREETQP